METRKYTVLLLDYALQKEFTWKLVPIDILQLLAESKWVTVLDVK